MAQRLLRSGGDDAGVRDSVDRDVRSGTGASVGASVVGAAGGQRGGERSVSFVLDSDCDAFPEFGGGEWGDCASFAAADGSWGYGGSGRACRFGAGAFELCGAPDY